MAISKARKTANNKWDKANMSTLACKVKKKDAEAFRAYCETKGSTANTELKEYVMQCIGQTGTPDSEKVTE